MNFDFFNKVMKEVRLHTEPKVVDDVVGVLSTAAVGYGIHLTTVSEVLKITVSILTVVWLIYKIKNERKIK